jgi:hypothetical protein
MKVGDLIRVRYAKDDQWYHGVVYNSPEDPESVNCIWYMWCLERSMVHVLAPDRDEIIVVSEG